MTAQRLSGGRPELPLVGDGKPVEVERLTPAGATVAARVGNSVLVASSRDELEAALERLRHQAQPRPGAPAEPGNEPADWGVVFDLDPALLEVPGAQNLALRRAVTLLHGLDRRAIHGRLALRDDCLALGVSSSGNPHAQVDQAAAPVAVDPAWLHWVPANATMGTFSVALASESAFWDSLFVLAEPRRPCRSGPRRDSTASGAAQPAGRRRRRAAGGRSLAPPAGGDRGCVWRSREAGKHERCSGCPSPRQRGECQTRVSRNLAAAGRPCGRQKAGTAPDRRRASRRREPPRSDQRSAAYGRRARPGRSRGVGRRRARCCARVHDQARSVGRRALHRMGSIRQAGAAARRGDLAGPLLVANRQNRAHHARVERSRRRAASGLVGMGRANRVRMIRFSGPGSTTLFSASLTRFRLIRHRSRDEPAD